MRLFTALLSLLVAVGGVPQRTFAADIYRVPSAGGRVQLVVGAASSPVVSPDSTKLAYFSHGLRVRDLSTGADRAIGPIDLYGGRAVWSPSGDRLAYARADNSTCAPPPNNKNCTTWDVWTSTPDGSDHRLIRRNAFEPSWSSKGDRLLVADAVSSGETARVAILTAEGAFVRGLSFGALITEPRWSHDGGLIAVLRETSMTRVEIFREDGRPHARFGRGIGLTWSPRERRLAYTWGNWVYVTNTAARIPRRIARGYQPAWAPDGARLAVVVSTRRSSQLVTVRKDGRARRVIATLPARTTIRSPTWSADGRWVYFGASRVP